MQLRKTLLGLAAVATLCAGSIAFAAPASAAPLWMALAVNQHGNVWYSHEFDSESSAKDSAISHCENRWAYDCSQSTSVPMSWYLVAADCVNADGDEYYSTGSSSSDYGTALLQATINANRNSDYNFARGDCTIIQEE